MKRNKIALAMALMATAGSMVACSGGFHPRNNSGPSVVGVQARGPKHYASACPADGQYDRRSENTAAGSPYQFAAKIKIAKIDGVATLQADEAAPIALDGATKEGRTASCIGAGSVQIDVSTADGKPGIQYFLLVRDDGNAFVTVTEKTVWPERSSTASYARVGGVDSGGGNPPVGLPGLGELPND